MDKFIVLLKAYCGISYFLSIVSSVLNQEMFTFPPKTLAIILHHNLIYPSDTAAEMGAVITDTGFCKDSEVKTTLDISYTK